MKELNRRLLEEAKVDENNRLRVDMFLNHQLDVEFIDKIGKEFHKRFKDENITKILTVEASGIAIAYATARYFHVPMIFARKSTHRSPRSDVYTTKVYSFTKTKSFHISIVKDYMNPDDRILIIDDFLGNGEAVLGLYSMILEAQADLVGVGMVIEKGFMSGGEIIRRRGIRLESLATIQSIDHDHVVLE